MRRLMRANGRRWYRSNLYWFFVVLMILFSVGLYVNAYRYTKRYDMVYSMEDFLFASYLMVGIGLAVVISVYVGTEYSDGTIRNKLIVGRKRLHIYLSSTLTCMRGSLLATLLGTAAAAAAGYLLFGGLKSSVSYILFMLLVYCMTVAAYASLYNLVAMLIASRTNSSIVNILLAFGLMFLAVYLYAELSMPPEIQAYVMDAMGEPQLINEPNPAYLDGMKREVYLFFMDLLPSGQALQVANLEALHPLRMIFCSLGITLGANALGVFLFDRMDIR